MNSGVIQGQSFQVLNTVSVVPISSANDSTSSHASWKALYLAGVLKCIICLNVDGATIGLAFLYASYSFKFLNTQAPSSNIATSHSTPVTLPGLRIPILIGYVDGPSRYTLFSKLFILCTNGFNIYQNLAMVCCAP